MTIEEYQTMLDSGQIRNQSRAARLRDCPLESEEQQLLFEWATLMSRHMPELEWLMHVPNGGLRNVVVAARLKAEGTRKGFPDIFLPCARGDRHGLMIELKRRKHGVVSPEQKAWLEHLNSAGYKAVVCRGFDEAREAIEGYLNER